MQPSLDQVVLCLAGWLGQEPVVLVAALHGLVPVDAVVVAATTAGVVVAAVDVVALSVAVVVVGGTHSATAASVTKTTVGDLVLLQKYSKYSAIILIFATLPSAPCSTCWSPPVR